jgi:hypothetical protein
MALRKIACLAIAAGVALCSTAPEGRAAEYAFTTYPLGILAFGAGITPPPGLYVTDAVSFYSASIGGNFDFGGHVFNAGVKAKFFSDELNILYVPNGKLFDGYVGVSVSFPGNYVNYQASATGPLGNTVTATAQGWGYGDTVVQAQIGWDLGDFSHSFYVLGVVPTGFYTTGFEPITGFNRPSLDVAWAFTWFNKDTKLEVNGAVGFMTSMENFATEYQTGNEFHFEWAIGYKFDNGLEIGVVGYDYRQLTGDSGAGALLGPFIGTVDAVGPGLSYSTKIGDTPVTINVRDYEQYNWKNFFHGNAAIASFTAVFPAMESMKDAAGSSPK